MRTGFMAMPALALAVVFTAGNTLSQQPAVSLSRAETEEFLRTAKIVKTRQLGKGVTNSLRATLSDGRITHDAHVQTIEVRKHEFQGQRGTEINFSDSYKFNIAAYRLDQLLGLNMIPVSVERKVGGSTAAVTWWVDDTLMDEGQRMKKKIQPPDQNGWNCQMHTVRVFDQLIFNTDRNLGNLVIDKDWKIWMIDHTRAFRIRRDLQNPKNLIRCDRAFLAKVRELNEEVLGRELGSYLTSAEIKALLARRDLVVKFFEDEARKKGDNAVFYDLARR